MPNSANPPAPTVRRAAQLLTLLAFAGSTLTASVALAQNAAKPAAQPAGNKDAPRASTVKKPIDQAAEYLGDFIHFVKLDRADLAKNYGEALLKMLPKPLGTAEGDGQITTAEFLKLFDDPERLKRFDQAARSALQGDTNMIASRLIKAYDTAKLDIARRPDEIAKNIQLLTGTQRNRLFGRDRLIFAGEYAMPQVLAAFIKRSDVTLTTELRQVILGLGRQSIIPIVTALPNLDPASQEQVIDVLGEIKYPTARPFLYDLYNSTKIDSVKKACEKAITRSDGTFDPSLKVAELYNNLGEGYYSQSRSLTSFPGEDTQLLWAYDPGVGLVMTSIATPVFHEAMAMRCCERALRLDSANQSALSLWLASNFSREIRTPKDYVNPAYGENRKDAMFYAVAAGPAATKRVLARGLDTRDVPLIRRAIAAIEKTAGANVLAQTEARNPLLEALRYPNRRVQYEAALALGVAQPKVSFEGAERVVPTLGSAIRDASAKYAVVIATRAEEAQSLENVARGLGYTVLPSGATLSAIEPAMGDVPGVDLVFSRQATTSSTEALISEIRANPRLGAVPVLAVLDGDGISQISAKYERDDSVKLVRTGTSPQQQTEAVKQLVDAALGGPVTPEEARAYQDRSLAALRDLAISGAGTLNVTDAVGPLVTALNDAKSPVRMQVAEVLSLSNEKRAQSALVESALAASGEDMTSLLGRATASAKKFGNLLSDKQVERLRKAAGAAATKVGDDKAATSLAALMGALKLESDKLIPLVLGDAK